ncbi:MAG: aspartate aminotransferase family protein [Candidatus Wukongarchaeota archaeon]|nr:aspartate aminotransferase family protein [Candidatus Wukongarchaeota archaeon]
MGKNQDEEEGNLSHNTKAVISLDERFVMQTYSRFPVVPVRAKGVKVWDCDGKEYIDCVSGIAVLNVGHRHPRILKVLKEQAEQLMHISNHFYIEQQAKASEYLAKIAPKPLEKTFWGNSGTEAVETALKLAIKYTGKHEFIAAQGSFHGRTMGALATTWNEHYRAPYAPFGINAKFVPFNDLQAIKEAVSKDTAGIILEPVQGQGGVNIPSNGYLEAVRELCDEKEILLIFDEVQTGFGRTGKLWAGEHWNVVPDIMPLAKALGGGISSGACIAKEEIAKAFDHGAHGTTFGGNPLACALSLEVMKIVVEENLSERAAELGKKAVKQLKELKEDLEIIKDVRGIGLLIGIEVSKDAKKLCLEMIKKGILITYTAEKVIRVIPPLVIKEEELEKALNIIAEGFKQH